MKTETIIYRLRMKGKTLADISLETGASRQLVSYAIKTYDKRDEESQADRVRQRIREILETQAP